MNNYNDYFFLFLLPLLATGQQLSCKVLIIKSELIRKKEQKLLHLIQRLICLVTIFCGASHDPMEGFLPNLVNLS